MRFVGIDSAYRNTGVVILNHLGDLVWSHHLKNKAQFDDLGLIFWERQADIILLEKDVVAIEGLSFGSVGMAHLLAGSYAMWLKESHKVSEITYVIPPIRVKKWAVNNVKAKKPDMIRWAKDELGYRKDQKLSEHEADAYALAQIAFHAYQRTKDLPTHRALILENGKGDGVTQKCGKSYFEGSFYRGDRQEDHNSGHR